MTYQGFIDICTEKKLKIQYKEKTKDKIKKETIPVTKKIKNRDTGVIEDLVVDKTTHTVEQVTYYILFAYDGNIRYEVEVDTLTDILNFDTNYKVDSNKPNYQKVILSSEDGKLMEIDRLGQLHVITPDQEAPEGTFPVQRTGYSEVSANSAEFDTYIIPNTQILKIQKFKAGTVDEKRSSKIILYYAPNGIFDGNEEIISLLYCGRTNDDIINRNFIGDGTAAIILERRRMDNKKMEVYAYWKGYLNLPDFNVLEEGISSSVGYDWLDRDASNSVWVANNLIGKSVIINESIIRTITGNSANVLWFSDGNDITGSNIRYKIIEFI